MKTKLFIISLMILTLVSCSKEKEPEHKYGDTLTVYSFNDVHGSIVGDGSNFGLDQASYLIKNSDNYIPEMTMLLSSGDMYQGSGLSNLTDGRSMVEVMNAMNFDAMAIGNHEFDWGVDTLKNNIELSNFPVLSYDVYNKSNDKKVDWLDSYTVVEKGGYKIGVIGEIGKIESSIASNMIKDYYFSPNVKEINSIAKKLKQKENCSAVFLITHNGPNSGYEKLNNNYVDAIFGGHTHEVTSKTYNNIPYYQNGDKIKGITKFTINLKTHESEGELHKVTTKEIRETPKDEALTSIISKYQEETSPILNEVIGNLEGKLNSSDLGTLVTKVMFEYGVSKGIDKDKLISVHNKAGVRITSLGETNQTTTITYGQVYEAFPFDNDVRLVKVKGSYLTSVGTTNYVYGIKSTALLDPNTIYNVISISYLTENENGTLYNDGGGECLDTLPTYCRDIVKDYIKVQGTITKDSLQLNYPQSLSLHIEKQTIQQLLF